VRVGGEDRRQCRPCGEVVGRKVAEHASGDRDDECEHQHKRRTYAQQRTGGLRHHTLLGIRLWFLVRPSRHDRENVMFSFARPMELPTHGEARRVNHIGFVSSLKPRQAGSPRALAEADRANVAYPAQQ
jgi:hypothetical protein